MTLRTGSIVSRAHVGFKSVNTFFEYKEGGNVTSMLSRLFNTSRSEDSVCLASEARLYYINISVSIAYCI